MKIQVYDDPDQCRVIWDALWPKDHLFDLWEVRSCFDRAYGRSRFFHTIQSRGRILGLLALSFDEKSGRYVQFPGETWHGRTWLERNRIVAKDLHDFNILLDSVDGPLDLRYLVPEPFFRMCPSLVEDEAGFLFFPARCNYSFDQYWQEFGPKTRKKLKSELRRLEERRVEYRLDHFDDLDEMFRLNLDYFSQTSYFSDPRFYRAFVDLAAWLKRAGMLKITTVLIDSKIAAVDMGAVFKNQYTLLAGGTHPEFGGVAKLINLFHIKRGCNERFDSVDFLCGDFNWKHRFHLTPDMLFAVRMTGVAQDALRCA